MLQDILALPPRAIYADGKSTLKPIKKQLRIIKLFISNAAKEAILPEIPQWHIFLGY